MRFDMTVRNNEGQIASGYSSPISVGNIFYEPFLSAVQVKNSNNSQLNISYEMRFTFSPNVSVGGQVLSNKSVEISAEGIYKANTGALGMIGCWNRGSYHRISVTNDSLDCEILISLQHPPLNANGGSCVKGTIKSTRGKSEPFHFEPLELISSSICTSQAKESINRMDLEITLVLISNTLACIFMSLQLACAKKHPDVLPSISVVMLTVLTLAPMVPLVLNFKALFLANHNQQNVFLDSGRWLEVNEVLIRVTTMIVFLLQFRLLQLTWSARVGDEGQKVLWASYKKIVFNLLCDSRGSALAPSFYVGTTLVHLLPHAYDLYRAHSSEWHFTCIYTNPTTDYYSTVWDFIISCGGLLFVSLIYLQQRFGGRCILPKRFRESSVYERVPVIGSE